MQLPRLKEHKPVKASEILRIAIIAVLALFVVRLAAKKVPALKPFAG